MTKEQILLSSGLFEISSEGEIWRVAKRHGRGVKPGGGYYVGATISPCQRVRAEYRTRDGYLLVATTINGVKVVVGAHRLVWVSLNGAIPEGMTINHKNGKKRDNSPRNLELATHSEQRRHALEVLNVNRNRPKGSKHPKTKLSEANVIEMRRLRLAGVMVKEIAARFNMKPRAVSAIIVGRTWCHI
jgi:hypothetical protein